MLAGQTLDTEKHFYKNKYIENDKKRFLKEAINKSPAMKRLAEEKGLIEKEEVLEQE